MHKHLTLNKVALHYLSLIAILLVGVGLRFWQLDTKPMWMDEVLTAIFSLGRSYADVPTQELFATVDLERLFTVQSGVSCPQIARTVAIESVHPPLFFCLLHSWVSWLNPAADQWIWALRSLPALMGVGAIAAVYWLNRVAFSATAGWLAAALMAVSPFAVYLSQEARHYTLPMLLITLALVGLVQMQQDVQQDMQQDMQQGRSRPLLRPLVWLGWVGVNVLGLYTHYFCLLAFVAQVVAFSGWLLWQQLIRQQLGWQRVVSLHTFAVFGFAVLGVGLSYLPWLSIVVGHFSRPETDWLTPVNTAWSDRLAPLYQTLVGWMLMVIALPIPDEFEAIALVPIAAIILFGLWLTRQLLQGAQQTWRQPSNQSALVLIAGFTLCVLIQFFAIVYVLNKDITAVPRYNFVYYPGVCALLGVWLSAIRPSQVALRTWAIVLMVGLLSSGLVAQGWVLQKPYNPDEIAENMLVQPTLPLLVVTHYRSLQEIALGLSIALELKTHASEFSSEVSTITQTSDLEAIADVNSDDVPLRFGFLDRRPQSQSTWQSLSNATTDPLPLPLNLWIVAPGSRRRDYPPQLRFPDPAIDQPNVRAVCTLDPEEHHRLGFPYQLYRCQ